MLGFLVTVLVGLWLFCGLMGMYVADQKRRSLVEGAAFGFLLGVLGLLIEALLPNQR